MERDLISCIMGVDIVSSGLTDGDADEDDDQRQVNIHDFIIFFHDI